MKPKKSNQVNRSVKSDSSGNKYNCRKPAQARNSSYTIIILKLSKVFYLSRFRQLPTIPQRSDPILGRLVYGYGPF